MRLPRGRTLQLAELPLVMGIINVTPDSFSDGGVNYDYEIAIEHALEMAADGAAIIDVGGESTRPGSMGVPLEHELGRVIPVIEGVRRKSDVAISVDTTKSEVARAAYEAGADIINDVSALRFDPQMGDVAAKAAMPVVLMHMRGEPRTMQENISFNDVIADVHAELESFVETAVRRGIDRDAIFVDPGIGFGKTFEHNLEILSRLADFTDIAPVVVGASRKAFIGRLTGEPGGVVRASGSLGAVAAAALSGAAVVRVHDVRETVDFLKVFKPIVQPKA